MASSSSATDLKTPRRIFRRVIVEKNPSTALSNDAEADHGPPSDFQYGQSFDGMKNNLRPLNVLQRATAISHDGKQQLAIFGMGKDIDGLGHDPRFAYLPTIVNPLIASVH